MEKSEEETPKEKIQRWLQYLRDGTPEYEECLRLLQEEVKNDGFTLTDIGTSEEELKELFVKGCKISAQQWLKYLRDGTTGYEEELRLLREETEKGAFTLADIGTSEEELKELFAKGCKVSAQQWLKYLRDGTTEHEDDINLRFLREEVQKGGFTLADIGTSEEELKELETKNKKE